jgi:hypothetical protein
MKPIKGEALSNVRGQPNNILRNYQVCKHAFPKPPKPSFSNLLNRLSFPSDPELPK